MELGEQSVIIVSTTVMPVLSAIALDSGRRPFRVIPFLQSITIYILHYFSQSHNQDVKIGVASYGAPVDFQLFNFSSHFRVAQNLTLDSM